MVVEVEVVVMVAMALMSSSDEDLEGLTHTGTDTIPLPPLEQLARPASCLAGFYWSQIVSECFKVVLYPCSICYGVHLYSTCLSLLL